jgi:hypothetical protein
MADEMNLNELGEFEESVPQDLPEDLENQTEHKDNYAIQYEEQETPEVKPDESEKVEPEKAEPKQDPSTYQYWQSQADKREKEAREAKERAEALQREIEQIKNQSTPVKEEPLVKPQAPTTDDPLDWITYNNKLMEYQEKLINQKFTSIDSYFQNLESERQTRAQQEQEAQQKAWYVGQMVRAGLNPDEASQALADFSKAADTPEQYFKDLAEFYRFKKGRHVDPKAQSMDKRVSRGQGIAPLGVIPSNTEPQNDDPSDAFFKDIKDLERKYF